MINLWKRIYRKKLILPFKNKKPEDVIYKFKKKKNYIPRIRQNSICKLF